MRGTVPLCGPFLSASNTLHSLSENLYQQRLLSEAIDMYCEYEKKMQDAIKNEEDVDYIISLQKESDYYDQIFQISIASAFNLYEA